MAYYLKEFSNETDYNDYINDNPLLPNVSLIGTSDVRYNPIVIEAGTIVYYDGTLKYCSQSEWVSSLGTPVAVVVVPNTHTPDGTVRCMAATGVNADGSQATSDIGMAWGPMGTDTPLPNLKAVPTWDNTVGGTIGSSYSGYLSSNKGFSGVTDCLDCTLKYYDNAGPFIPNPYLPDGSPNPDYRSTTITNNACADFDGSGNTAVLVGLSAAYSAANACHLYNTNGISAGEWYLPACGELGYIMPMFNQIQASLNAVGGVQLRTGDGYWCSSENSSYDSHRVHTLYGGVNSYYKADTGYVRPFCSLSPLFDF